MRGERALAYRVGFEEDFYDDDRELEEPTVLTPADALAAPEHDGGTGRRPLFSPHRRGRLTGATLGVGAAGAAAGALLILALGLARPDTSSRSASPTAPLAAARVPATAPVARTSHVGRAPNPDRRHRFPRSSRPGRRRLGPRPAPGPRALLPPDADTANGSPPSPPGRAATVANPRLARSWATPHADAGLTPSAEFSFER